MNMPHKLQLRLQCEALGPGLVPRAIETFHSWISEHALDEVLIDVADYRHVGDGPGVVLVGLDANYMLETRGREAGAVALSCFRKRTGPTDPLLDVLRRTLRAAKLLQAGLGEAQLRFHSQTLELCVVDRKITEHAPFDASAFASCVGDRLCQLFDAAPVMTLADHVARPTVVATWPAGAPIATVLQRIEQRNPLERQSG